MNAELTIRFETDDPDALSHIPELVAGELSYRLAQFPDVSGEVSTDDFSVRDLTMIGNGDINVITAQIAIDENGGLHDE